MNRIALTNGANTIGHLFANNKTIIECKINPPKDHITQKRNLKLKNFRKNVGETLICKFGLFKYVLDNKQKSMSHKRTNWEIRIDQNLMGLKDYYKTEKTNHTFGENISVPYKQHKDT